MTEPLTQPLTVVHIVDPGLVGGMQSVVEGLAVGHHRRGHHVHVIGVVDTDPAAHPWLNVVRAAGVQTHGVQVGSRQYLRERRLIRDILKGVRPDVVHTHGPHCDLITSGVARGLRIPVVTTLHGSSLLGGKTVLTEWLQYRMLARFDGVIAVSGKLVEELRATKVKPERVHWIPNAAVPTSDRLSRDAARAALGLSPDETVIGWVARMIPVKDCANFLRAFSACRGKPVRAALIGDGPERAALKALASELGLTTQVTFCGLREQAGRLAAAFDYFALSSQSEGTPMTLLEAVGAGVPVISTAVGGIPDVVPAETHALLAPPNDSVALGAALVRAVEDPAASRRRAQAAKERLDTEFAPDKWLARHEELYRDLEKTRSREGEIKR